MFLRGLGFVLITFFPSAYRCQDLGFRVRVTLVVLFCLALVLLAAPRELHENHRTSPDSETSSARQ